VIWPVEWINASPENLEASFQTDYINMAVDSYSVNGNQALAYQRYTFLGASGPEALGRVIENPVWVSPAEVDAYTQAILDQGGEQALGAQPTASKLPRVLRTPAIYYLGAVILLGLLAIVLLSTALVRALRPREVPSAETTPVTEVQPPGQEEIVEAPPVQESTEARVETIEAAPEEDTQPVQVAMAAEAATAVVHDEVKPEEGGVGMMGAAAAVGAAGLVGAAIAGSDREEAGETSVTPEERITEVAKPESDQGGLPEGAVAAAALAMAGDRDETVEQEAVTTEAGEAALASEVGWALEEEASSTSVVAEEVVTSEPVSEEWIQEPEVQPEQESEYFGKYNRKLIEVEGIGPAYSEKLAEVGITSTHAYLQACATPKGRQQLAESTGISGKLILEWANHIDLMRIQGIGPQWSDLLEAAGVDTVRELATRNPANLLNQIVEINDEKSLVRQLPTLDKIEDWVEQAKELPRILNY
jgi:predicted flap endonuclease-1-like 5' DNA nuclease